MDTDIVIFDFENNVGISNWRVVDDVVMGGRSDGDLEISDKGFAVFKGRVSLENNGGFSSIRYQFDKKELSGQSKAFLKVKGDGKDYQLRFKSNSDERHSYIAEFSTTNEWQTIEIDISKMYPAFRGRNLNIPNYPGENLAEIAILIGNKKAEDFELHIQRLVLKK